MGHVLRKRAAVIAGVLLVLASINFFYMQGNDPVYNEVVSERVLVPGGQTVGIQMDVKGVLVVGLEKIVSEDGYFENPGLKAGLQIGDLIVAINGQKVYKASEVDEIVSGQDDPVVLDIKRKNRTFQVQLSPVKSAADGKYKLGLWIKDKTAGIGTLTYYDPVNMTYGALGHAITDSETGTVLTVNEGELIKAQVTSVKEGKSGQPGEIQGIFYESDAPIGTIEYNSTMGIFGKAYEPVQNPLYSQPMRVASVNEIETGPAYILTTLEDNRIGKYDVEIQKIYRRDSDSEKNMIIKVTDEELLDKSGGIVQGMSGSPIIQDGKLVGAVTHVLVNDPTRGYGIFIENMLEHDN